MQKTQENSQEQADIIKLANGILYALDLEYCRELATDMRCQASRQESLAVLNPRHPQAKNDLLRVQGQALARLVEYVELLKLADEYKAKVQQEESRFTAINALFI